MKIDRLGFFWDLLGMNNYLKKVVVSGELQEKNTRFFNFNLPLEKTGFYSRVLGP